MANTLSVTLCSNVRGALDVDDHDKQNDVDKNQNAQKITWQLMGSLLNGGEFVDMNDPEPGFAWIPNPPVPNPFEPPNITGNGKILSIMDKHRNESSTGDFHYILRVRYQGVVYQTIGTLRMLTITNPAIINK